MKTDNLVFILWKLHDHANTIEIMCYDVQTFKSQYAAHKHLTADNKKYYWTREHLVIND
jgi:hypothetical protein